MVDQQAGEIADVVTHEQTEQGQRQRTLAYIGTVHGWRRTSRILQLWKNHGETPQQASQEQYRHQRAHVGIGDVAIALPPDRAGSR